MQFFDVNVLVYAFRETSDDHELYRQIVTDARHSSRPLAVSDVVLSGFVRTVTRMVGDVPGDPVPDAFAYCDWLLRSTSCVRIHPSPPQFELFRDLCIRLNITGSRTTDAYLAATAIVNDCTWVTADRGFGVYPGLRWRLLPDDQLFTNPT